MHKLTEVCKKEHLCADCINSNNGEATDICELCGRFNKCCFEGTVRTAHRMQMKELLDYNSSLNRDKYNLEVDYNALHEECLQLKKKYVSILDQLELEYSDNPTLALARIAALQRCQLKGYCDTCTYSLQRNLPGVGLPIIDCCWGCERPTSFKGYCHNWEDKGNET